jgi:hypothetical protein
MMKRVVLLFVFERILDSFGVDWTIEETIPLLVAIFIYALFFAIRPSRTTESPGAALGGDGKSVLGMPAATR